MVKSLCIMLFALCICAASALPAFAAESGDIKVTYSKPDPEKVTVVDLAWGSMEFNYTDGGATKVWNPETMKYEIVAGNGEGGSWTPKETGGDTVTVTNHSNTGLLVTVVYTPEAENGVSGTVENGSFMLSTAVETDFDNAPKDSAKLTLDPASKPASWSDSGATIIGNITVKLDHCDTMVSTLEEFNAALAKGGTVLLAADITLDGNLPDLKSVTINLNGYTLTPHSTFGLYVSSGTLTLTGDGTINGEVWAVYDGTVNLQGGTVEEAFYVDYGGVAQLSGCSVETMNCQDGATTITDSTVSVLKANPGCSVTISSGSVDVIWTMDGSRITISGGHVRLLNDNGGDLTITGGTFGFDPTQYLAEGYTATKADNIWTVTAKQANA